jgi:hypothetical protein
MVLMVLQNFLDVVSQLLSDSKKSGVIDKAIFQDGRKIIIAPRNGFETRKKPSL